MARADTVVPEGDGVRELAPHQRWHLDRDVNAGRGHAFSALVLVGFSYLMMATRSRRRDGKAADRRRAGRRVGRQSITKLWELY